MTSVMDEASQLAGIDDIEIRSIPLGEFVLDSGDRPSLYVEGRSAETVSIAIVGSHLRIGGQAPKPRPGAYPIQVYGSYIAGVGPFAELVTPGTDPFRMRTTFGDVKIRLTLPPGKHVRVMSDFGTFSTPAPLGPEQRREVLARAADIRCEPLRRKAEECHARAELKFVQATAAEAAGRPEKAEARRREAEIALHDSEELEHEARLLYEELTRPVE